MNVIGNRDMKEKDRGTLRLLYFRDLPIMLPHNLNPLLNS